MASHDRDPLTTLDGRIRRFLDAGDDSAILAADTLSLAGQALVEAAGDTTLAPDRILAVAWLHWFRYEALHQSPDGAAQHEVAAILFAILFAVTPERVPESHRQLAGSLVGAGFAATPADWDVQLGDVLIRIGHAAADPYALTTGAACIERGIADGRGINDQDATRYNLAQAYRWLHEVTGTTADLDRAVAAARNALVGRARADMLLNLTVLLRQRFEKIGDYRDLDESITVGTSAVEAAPESPAPVLNLGVSYRVRYEYHGNPDDLEHAARLGRVAAKAAGDLPPDQAAAALSMLSLALAAQYQRTADDGTADEALAAANQAVDTLPLDHPDIGRYLTNRDQIQRSRYRTSGHSNELLAAIDSGRQSIMQIAPTDPLFVFRLTSLAALLIDQHRAGEPARRHAQTQPAAAPDASLREAIALYRQALHLTPDPGPDRDRSRGNLAEALLLRFELFGEVTDLDEAIALGAENTAHLAVTDIPSAVRAVTQSVARQRRFSHYGDRADIDHAIALGRAATAALAGHPQRPAALTALGLALAQRGMASDPDEAVQVLRDAYRCTHPNAVEMPNRRLNLASALFQRHHGRPRNGDLAEAEHLLRELLADHTDSALSISTLLLLGLTIYAGLQSRDPVPVRLREAFDCWRRVAEATSAAATTRMATAILWAQAAAQHGYPRDQAAAGHAAVTALEALAWPGTTRATQEQHLAGWAAVTRDSAAAETASGNPGAAVELLERGRAILWTQRIQPHRHADQLRAIRPDLAKRLDTVRKQLDTAADRGEASGAIKVGGVS